MANSDPAVIAFAAGWIRLLSRNKLHVQVHYHADQDLDEIRSFWGSLLCVNAGAIGVSWKSNSSQLTGRHFRCRHGVCTVRTNDTLLRARMQGWIDCLRERWLDSEPGGV